MRSYRINEGVLLIQSGPHMDLTFKTYRVEYHGDERTDIPYPGLEQFKNIRVNRDIHFGEPSAAQQIAPGDAPQAAHP